MSNESTINYPEQAQYAEHLQHFNFGCQAPYFEKYIRNKWLAIVDQSKSFVYVEDEKRRKLGN